METKDCIVGYTDLMYVFNCSDETVRQYVEQGMPKAVRGKYSLRECAKWRIQQLADQLDIAKSSGDEKLHGLKMHGQRIANRANEIKLRKMLGELVDLQAAKLAWLNETTIFRKALTAMVFKLAANLENCETRQQRLSVITAEIHAVMDMIGDLRIDGGVDLEELENFEEEDASTISAG